MRRLALVIGLIAGCAHAPAPEKPPPPPPLVDPAEGGWFDIAGFYHDHDSTFIVQLPRDATLARSDPGHKHVLAGGINDIGFMIAWWHRDKPPTQGDLDAYIERFDTESQPPADRIHDVPMRGAVRARATQWTDPSSGIVSEIRAGWRASSFVVMMTFANKGSKRAAELQRVIASLAFAN